MGDESDKGVGEVLKRLRERAGLSQRQLAEGLGVQQPAVARWEAGGVQMPINRLEEVLGYFGYGVSYDLTAVPISGALDAGVPFQLVRRQPNLPDHPRRVVSGEYEFAVDATLPWVVDMWNRSTRVRLPGTVAIIGAAIDEIASHPDGILVRQGSVVGKVTSSAKSREDGSVVFAYTPADNRDMELACLGDSSRWLSTSGD